MADLESDAGRRGAEGASVEARSAEVERRLRREGGGVWGGVSPSPPVEGFEEGARPPPQNFF